MNPSYRNFFLSGLCLGLVATFGRNHGVYGLLGATGIICWLQTCPTTNINFIKCSLIWVLGILSGFSPVLFMMLLIPNFSSTFWESVLFLIEAKATNISLPIPWPWHTNFTLAFNQIIRELLIGLFFIGIILFGSISIVWIIWQRSEKKHLNPSVIASAFLALPYAHHAFSRGDLSHLAQGVFPLLIGCLAFLSSQPVRIKYTSSLLLCVSSLWVMCTAHPGWYCYVNKKCEDIEILRDQVSVDQNTANDVFLLQGLTERFAPNTESFLVTPFWPGAYPLFERKSPTWEIYALFPRNTAFEQAEIERIRMANPKFILVMDQQLDGRDDLRFKSTHPLTYEYIVENFQVTQGLPSTSYKLFTPIVDTQ